ncbi:hypothetical protein JOD18_002632 [Gracilibacillus alcaliphilus]|nr:hypothetical protein [Gracilibacillus alcaliphilus]
MLLLAARGDSADEGNNNSAENNEETTSADVAITATNWEFAQEKCTIPYRQLKLRVKKICMVSK